jgi:hypothetical protein
MRQAKLEECATEKWPVVFKGIKIMKAEDNLSAALPGSEGD